MTFALGQHIVNFEAYHASMRITELNWQSPNYLTLVMYRLFGKFAGGTLVRLSPYRTHRTFILSTL